MAQHRHPSNTHWRVVGSSRDLSYESVVSEDFDTTTNNGPPKIGMEPLASSHSQTISLQRSSKVDGQHPPSCGFSTRQISFYPSGGQHNPTVTGRKPSARISHATLVEDDSHDMSLLKDAAPIGETARHPTTSRPTEETSVPRTPFYDMTSFLGPMNTQDYEFMRSLQEQEANGKLTGGLGAGLSPETTMTGDELLATSPKLKRSFSYSRGFSVRRKHGVRNEIRSLGQSAANKTGEVIEVVMEEPSGIDLSNMIGPTPITPGLDQMRRSTFPRMDTKTELFYPQPDWKPFTMRWPYLVGLIVLSLGLAIAQELLYRQSLVAPLMRFQRPDEIKPADYFVLKFLPTIITVSFGVLWSMTDSEVKRLEAFYQMSKEGGALAAESINVDYLTSFTLMRPIRALQRKHYAVAVSSIATLLAISLVPTLGSAAIVLNPDRTTRHEDMLVEKTITMHPVLSRLLTSTLIIIAVLGLILLYQLGNRRSGLLADVKGIAGLASMAVVSHILMDFKDMDVAKPKDIHYKLRKNRYILRNSSLAQDESSTTTIQEEGRNREVRLSENPHPLTLRTEGAIPFIAGILLFLVFIPIFLFTAASELTDKAPWLVTALAVGIKLAWGSLETDIRMTEPYYILSKRHAPAKTLTLDYTAMPFGWVAIRALLNKHWLVFLVGFGTVLSETLTIFVTSLATVEGKDFIDQIRRANDDNENAGSSAHHDPDNFNSSGQETVLSFVVSLVFTVFILLYMLAVAAVVFARRRHPFLPRQPNTIASVLAFMHQSKMLYDFVGTAKLGNAEMARWLGGVGKTYGLGWFEGRDGQTHCGVDEEELMGGYKHGVDYGQINKPWGQDWQFF